VYLQMVHMRSSSVITASKYYSSANLSLISVRVCVRDDAGLVPSARPLDESACISGGSLPEGSDGARLRMVVPGSNRTSEAGLVSGCSIRDSTSSSGFAGPTIDVFDDTTCSAE
jgi:hypothetical protein